MKCPEFTEQLQTFLDGHPVPPSLRDHAQECVTCRALLAAGERLLHSLRAGTPPPPLSSAFTEKVMAQFREERMRAGRRRRWLGVAMAAAAVIVLGTLAPMLPMLQRAQKSAEPPPLARQPEESPPAEASVIAAREAGRSTLDRTRKVAEDAVRQASILFPPNSELQSPPLLTAAEPPELPVQDLGKSVSDGLEPVTKSTRRAFDVWLNMLPMGSHEQEKPGL